MIRIYFFEIFIYENARIFAARLMFMRILKRELFNNSTLYLTSLRTLCHCYDA